MVTGFVLGKFYPLHTGHTGLIEFAVKQCDELIVLVCASDKENIPGSVRLLWVKNEFKHHPKVNPVLLNYSEQELPNTSASSEEVSKIWASAILRTINNVDVVFSSEPYGYYLAECLKCRHVAYEPARTTIHISASAIRENIFQHWDYMANSAKPFFVKKICILGTESTGKSTLTEQLAVHYQTEFVPEMAREIIAATDDCTEKHLRQIATLHAKTIKQKLLTADKLLFIDTDINITRSYSKYLFGKELIVSNWVEEANQSALYLYLDNDVPYIQDGTRLDKQRRDELNCFHQNELRKKNVNYKTIKGSWKEKFDTCVTIVDDLFINQ